MIIFCKYIILVCLTFCVARAQNEVDFLTQEEDAPPPLNTNYKALKGFWISVLNVFTDEVDRFFLQVNGSYNFNSCLILNLNSAHMDRDNNINTAVGNLSIYNMDGEILFNDFMFLGEPFFKMFVYKNYRIWLSGLEQETQ